MRMINPLFWCCAYEDIKFKFNTKITISIQIIFKYGINFKFYLINNGGEGTYAYLILINLVIYYVNI